MPQICHRDINVMLSNQYHLSYSALYVWYLVVHVRIHLGYVICICFVQISRDISLMNRYLYLIYAKAKYKWSVALPLRNIFIRIDCELKTLRGNAHAMHTKIVLRSKNIWADGLQWWPLRSRFTFRLCSVEEWVHVRVPLVAHMENKNLFGLEQLQQI